MAEINHIVTLANEGMGQVLLFVVIAIVAIVGSIYSYYEAKKRREEIAAFAAQHGFTFRPAKASKPYPYSIFDDGHSRWSRFRCYGSKADLINGLAGEHSVELFEYHYAVTSGSGKNRRTTHYHFGCLALDARVSLGRLFVRDEHFGDKLASAIGFDDIDFEDHQFSKEFLVKSDDRQLAYEIFHPPMMRFMLGNQGWVIETRGTELFVWKRGRPRAATYRSLMGFASDFVGHLPRTMINRERNRLGLETVIDAGFASDAFGRGEPAAEAGGAEDTTAMDLGPGSISQDMTDVPDVDPLDRQ